MVLVIIRTDRDELETLWAVKSKYLTLEFSIAALNCTGQVLVDSSKGNCQTFALVAVKVASRVIFHASCDLSSRSTSLCCCSSHSTLDLPFKLFSFTMVFLCFWDSVECLVSLPHIDFCVSESVSVIRPRTLWVSHLHFFLHFWGSSCTSCIVRFERSHIVWNWGNRWMPLLVKFIR